MEKIKIAFISKNILKDKNNLFSISVLTLILFVLSTVQVCAQDDDITQTREITSDAFTKKRPKNKKNNRSNNPPNPKNSTGDNSKEAKNTIYKLSRKQAPRRPKTSTLITNQTNIPKNKAKNNKSSSGIEQLVVKQLGITMWRLRPERSIDSGARLLTQGSSEKLVAQRVSLDTFFRPKDKVRISIESPLSGYLYIIDREMLADGTLGDPFLIFPTLKTNGGNNYVIAGQLVEIPSQTDDPFYFEINPLDDNYTGELITVILSPTKIPNLRITDEPLKLQSRRVEGWEDSWEQTASIFELDDDENTIYTEEEKQAGSGTRQLTQNSPPPKSVIAVKVPSAKTLLVNFSIKVKQ